MLGGLRADPRGDFDVQGRHTMRASLRRALAAALLAVCMAAIGLTAGTATAAPTKIAWSK